MGKLGPEQKGEGTEIDEEALGVIARQGDSGQVSEDSQAVALKQVVIYTDGAATPNPGAGGYGVVLRYGEHEKELSGGYARTNSNRMELMAVIAGLEALKERCQVVLHTDSLLIVQVLASGAAARWRTHLWKRKATASKRVKNADLWERLLIAYERHDVEVVWVQGHAGVADNERCDRLADLACRQPDLPEDPGFTEPRKRQPGNSLTTSTQPNSLRRVTDEGQPCRKCNTAVVKRRSKKQTPKQGQHSFLAWHLFCPNCTTSYTVETARVFLDPGRAMTAPAPAEPAWSVKVIAATRAHRAAWLRLRDLVYTGLDQAFHEQEVTLWLRHKWKQCFLAVASTGEVCGLIEISLRSVVDGCLTTPVGYIEGIYVDPPYRGTGLARQLLQRAEVWCREKGCSEIATDAELDNTAAQQFHTRMGFEETYRVVQYRKKLKKSPQLSRSAAEHKQ